MLKLLALAEADGYAFVEDSEFLFFVRPPYSATNKSRVSRESIGVAVGIHGFATAAEEFKDWADLVEALTKKAISARRSRGENPDGDRIRSLAAKAPLDRVESLLSRTEQEMLPAHEWKQAMSLLTVLLRNPALKGSPPLYDKCVALLQSCHEGIEREDTRDFGWLDIEGSSSSDFPLVQKKYGAKAAELARRVRDDGYLMAVGS
jgi:hypothetical protein